MIEISTAWIIGVVLLLSLALGAFIIVRQLHRRFRLVRAGSLQYRKMDSLVREPVVTEKETIIKETETIYRVKCQYCGRLYNEALGSCPHCGGKR